MTRQHRTTLALAGLALTVGLGATSCSSDADSTPSGLITTPGGTTYQPSDFVGSAYSGIFIEADALGLAVQQAPLDLFMEEVQRLIDGGYLLKPDGMSLQIDENFQDERPEKTPFTFEEVQELVKTHRSLEPPAGSAGLYILYLDGSYEGDTEDAYTLGFAYGGSVIVVFRENLVKASKGLVGAPGGAIRATATSLLIHEFGHILGLVNNGTPMQNDHQDSEHGAHDVDEDCVMYWEAERPGIADKIAKRFGLGNETALRFGDECLADLKAAAK